MIPSPTPARWSLLLHLLLTLHLLGACPNPSTKALTSPVVFQGRLVALARRGPTVQIATFRAEKFLKGLPQEDTAAKTTLKLLDSSQKDTKALLDTRPSRITQTSSTHRAVKGQQQRDSLQVSRSPSPKVIGNSPKIIKTSLTESVPSRITRTLSTHRALKGSRQNTPDPKSTQVDSRISKIFKNSYKDSKAEEFEARITRTSSTHRAKGVLENNRHLKNVSTDVQVEFSARRLNDTCRRGAGRLRPGQQYVVFARIKRKGSLKMVAVAEPEPFSKRRQVAGVLCRNCAKAPSVKGLKDTKVKTKNKLRLKCRIWGNPAPRIVWFKDGVKLKADGRIKLRSKRRYSHLVINDVTLEDAGRYECQAKSLLGTSRSSAVVTVEETIDTSYWNIIRRESCPIENFCLNGGVCIYFAVLQEYVCECAEGFMGVRCERKAISSLNSSSPMLHDAKKSRHDMNATTLMLQHFWG